jgi:hypothetical protein
MNSLQDIPITRTGLSIGLLSAAVVAFQLALMQVFSITQWYHFAHMIISIALLGFGTSGTVLALFRKQLMKRFSSLFPLLLLLASISMATVTFFVHLDLLRFDTYLLFNDFTHIVRMAITCLFLMLPLFFAALAIGMSFIRYSGKVGKIYFANLLGSGIGGGLALGLMWLAAPSRLPALIAILPFIGGCIGYNRSASLKSAIGISVAILILMICISPPLVRSQYKSIQKALLLTEARIIDQKSSPYGLVELVRSPVLRYAPGLSLNYTKPVPSRDILYHNGDWLGAVIPAPPPDSLTILSFTAGALPYAVRQPGKVLIMYSGAGENIALARSCQADSIDAVEPNRTVTSLLGGELAAQTDSLMLAAEVRTYHSEPRTFLRTTDTAYDLIQLPVIGSFFGTSGLEAFSIRNELTLEAFQEMWHKLTSDGMISVTCWMDYPVRIPLKIMATLSSLMNSQGIKEPGKHLAAVRSWSALSFVVKRSEFTLDESQRILAFCDSLSFDPLFLPGIGEFNREYYNQLNDPWFFKAMDELMSPQAEAFAKSYPFRIEPATDNQPYFSQFIRMKSVPRLKELFGSYSVPYLELGYVVVLLAFLILFSVSVILILLPVTLIGYKMAEKVRTFFYFGSLGLGYMFLEMGLIQQFTLFLGQPVYSASAVISILLISSGLGSYLSARIKPVSKRILAACAAVAGVLLLYAFEIVPVLNNLMDLPSWIRFLFMIILVGIPGILMGIPFPLGLTRLGGKSPQSVPWAWGINGFASVTGTSLAIILSVEAGFNWVLFGATGAYAIAALTNR